MQTRQRLRSPQRTSLSERSLRLRSSATNILILDTVKCCAGLDFGMRCLAAGHQVKWFLRPGRGGEVSKVGDGMVPKVTAWEREAVGWADLIVLMDNTFFLDELAPTRERGVAIFGASPEGAELELDRDRGQKFMKANGIDTIPSKEFTDYDSAIAYVRKQNKRFVSKPSGDADKALSYVSKSPADMIFMLDRWKKLGKNKAPFILQEFVEGIEIAVGGWIGPSGFNGWWFENFEHKKLFPGDHGPNTGEMLTIGKYTRTSYLADTLLKPCEEALSGMGMTTYVDCAAIMDAKGNLRPLEWTVRFGWPTMNLQTHVHLGDPAGWMYDLCRGDSTLEVSEDHVTGVVMAIPDFPYSKLTNKEVAGFPIYNLDQVDPAGVHLCEVMMGQAPTMEGDRVVTKRLPVSAGDYILVATGRGETVGESVDEAYGVLDVIEMPNSPFWRDDGGERVTKQLPELQEFSFCDSWRL